MIDTTFKNRFSMNFVHRPLSVSCRFLLLMTIAWLSMGLPTVASAWPFTQQESSEDDLRGWIPTQRLTAHGNKARLGLQMLPCHLCSLGDTMQLKVTSQEEGYLFLLDINSAGQLTRIFPNKYSKPSGSRGLLRIPGYIKAGQTVMIPDDNYGFNFTATEPIGKGLVIALLVEQELSDYILPDDFETIQATESYATLQRLNQYLNSWPKGGQNRPLRWSITTLDYEITR
ncbi:MAG: hypothetical protein DRR19_07350 [Candidatus Parabeggiatoa sp. nov. 1]|nr:MAG: hypothetical protein DRR19_07350 [Gammaproteobacteria bacterium]